MCSNGWGSRNVCHLFEYLRSKYTNLLQKCLVCLKITAWHSFQGKDTVIHRLIERIQEDDAEQKHLLDYILEKGIDITQKNVVCILQMCSLMSFPPCITNHLLTLISLYVTSNVILYYKCVTRPAKYKLCIFASIQPFFSREYLWKLIFVYLSGCSY